MDARRSAFEFIGSAGYWPVERPRVPMDRPIAPITDRPMPWQIPGCNEPLPDDDDVPNSHCSGSQGPGLGNVDGLNFFQMQASSSQPAFIGFQHPVPDSTPREAEETAADAILEQELPRPPHPARPPVRRRSSGSAGNSQAAEPGNDRRANRFQWESWMVESLLELKKSEWEEYESQTSREHIISADVRWARISDSMKDKGCNSDASQCCGKWETVVGAYRKVKDHNNRSGNPFATLSKTERKDAKLPLDFPDRWVEILNSFYAQRAIFLLLVWQSLGINLAAVLRQLK
ncbi:hypothetical protein R1sor_009090 [Riccia sorocarpa]|uniref:Myb/SANT-like DNA-binding domain-containing protein n=1 Tax=Riccia sorocarpa TaxID=122646 RepID=A0ABD3H8S1_9MARC